MSSFALKLPSSVARLTAFVFLTLPALADTVTLVDGTKIDGDVISESEEIVVVRTRVGGIWDEKRLDAGEVRSIERESPESKAWQDASVSLPTADLLSSTDYEKLINKKLKPFLREFPSGEYAEAAKTQLATLENELQRITAGEIKFDGAWMSASEYADRRYWVDAERVFRDLLERVEKGSLVTALRRFHQLETEYGDSVAYAAAVPVIRPVLEKYDRDLSTAIVRAPGLVSQRTEMLATLSPSERKRTENEIMRSDAEAKARAESERADKMKWLTPNPYDESSLKAIQATVRKELELVAKLEPAVLERRARVLELIDRTISEGSLDKAQELLVEHDELLKNSSYFKTLKQKLEDLIKERNEEAAIVITSLQEEDGEDNKEEIANEKEDVADENKDADSQNVKSDSAIRAEEAARALDANSDTKAETNGSAETEKSEVTEEVSDTVAAEPVVKTPKATPAAKSAGDTEAAKEEEESNPIILGVLIALVVVLVGAVIFNVRGKKKTLES